MTLRLHTNASNAMLNALRGLLDAGSGPGHIRFYTGSQPATPDTAASGTLLADINLADPAYGAASTRQIALAEVAADTADVAGVAGWARLLDSDNNAVIDMSVGMSGSGAEIILQNTNLAVGQTVDIAGGGVITLPSG